MYTYLKQFEKEQYMLNSVKRFVNKEEIKHLLSSKKNLLETKNYYDEQIKEYNETIKELLVQLRKTNNKSIISEIEGYFDIQDRNIEESNRLNYKIDEINNKLKLLGYFK